MAFKIMLGSTGTHPSRTPDSTFCASTFVPSITSGPKMHHLRGNYPPSLGSNMNNLTERYKQYGRNILVVMPSCMRFNNNDS